MNARKKSALRCDKKAKRLEIKEEGREMLAKKWKKKSNRKREKKVSDIRPLIAQLEDEVEERGGRKKEGRNTDTDRQIDRNINSQRRSKRRVAFKNVREIDIKRMVVLI